MTPTVGRADRWHSGLQRMVTNGDVIYVHSPPRHPEAPALVLPAPEPEAPESEAPPRAELEPIPAEEAPIVVRTGLDRWTYTPAPPGYAHEFGTGRLVPVHRNLAPD